MKRAGDSKDIVRRGYDHASSTYRADQEDEKCRKYHVWIDRILPLIPDGSRVLDLGCGCGIPVAKRLSATHSVTGIDISPVQIERARRLVPDATFICADMSTVDFPNDSFAAIVAFYALFHVPLREQPQLFRNVHRWMVPGGYFMAMVGRLRGTRTVKGWLNIPGLQMYFSHADLMTYESWLREAEFEIIGVTMVEDVDDALPLILARTKDR